jgi:excisionase family DNA binding protein
MGLLIDSREAAKLLKISEKTLWSMWNEGKMPKPIRIGKAVRFSYEELQAWVNAGGPPQKEWKWPRQE